MPLFTDVILSNGRELVGATQTDCSNQRTFSRLGQQRLSILAQEVGFALFVVFGGIRSVKFCPSLESQELGHQADDPSTWFLGQPSTVIRQNIKPSIWHFQTVTVHQKHSTSTNT